MKSLYFLPMTGNATFDDLNRAMMIQLKGITEVLSFPLDTIDNYFPEKFEANLPETLFIPTILDNRNGISYDGVEYAMRWYLFLLSNNKTLDFQLILIGAEDELSFFKNSDYGDFLKCPNIHYLQNSLDNIQNYLSESQSKTINPAEAIETLKKAGIKPPTSYKSHHSIANEWSILRWAEILGLDIEDDKMLRDVRKTIGSSLYYRYLQAINPIPANSVVRKSLTQDGKVLLIDDEVEKGWHPIFAKICKDVSFSSIGQRFKNMGTDDIVVEAVDRAKNADVVILDLRLHDDDFGQKNPRDLTGYKILRAIKAHNKGIQIIIFSATNKVWNLQILQEFADGFILKESPNNSGEEIEVTNAIDGIYNIIDSCLRLSFLKKIITRTQTIRSLGSLNHGYESFFNRIEIDLDISFDLLSLTNKSAKYFSYAYLQLFQIIENFVSLETVFKEGDDSSVMLHGQEIYVQSSDEKYVKRPIKLTQQGKYEIAAYSFEMREARIPRLDINFKVASVLIFKYGNNNSSVLKWTDIYTLRNKQVAHYNSTGTIDNKDIFKLIDFIEYFINSQNENRNNAEKGLIVKTQDEKLALLLARHGKQYRK